MQFGAVWCSLSIYLDLLQTTWVIYTYNTCAYKEKRAGVWMNNYICLKHLQKRFLGAEHFHWYYKGNGDTKHESRKTGMMLVFFLIPWIDIKPVRLAAHKDACLRSGHSHEVLVCAPQKSLESTGRNLSFIPEESSEQVFRLLFAALISSTTKSSLETKGFLTSQGFKVCFKCSQGRNPSRSHGEKLFTGLLPADCSVCIFIQLRTDHFSKSGNAHSELDLLTPIIK